MSAQPAIDAADVLRIGFAGLGWIGRMRLDAIAGGPARISALADIDPQRLQAAREAYPEAIAVPDLSTMLESPLDGVVIATPNGAHAAQAIACLERGVAVFCQKPLATTADDAAQVVAAARRADRLLGVDFCYRHVQGMPELRERIRSGELGRLISIDLTFHNAYAPDKAWCRDRRLSGGGCLLDLGVHLLDLAAWLQGGAALSIVSSRLFSEGRRLRKADGAVEDYACAQLEQENGVVIRIACSWNAHAGCDAVIGAQIHGSEGGAAWRNVAGSFHDFTVDVFHGTRRERIGSPPDAWGARALRAWLGRLRVDRSFDEEAAQFQHTAAVIDRLYHA